MGKINSKGKKEIIVVGDRVLISPDESRLKTNYGLYLPQGVEEKEKVQTGFVVKIGPGYPLPDPGMNSDEPWSSSQRDIKYIPLQVDEGDYVIFLRKSALEIEYDKKKYVIVPQSAILLIIRENLLKDLASDDS